MIYFLKKKYAKYRRRYKSSKKLFDEEQRKKLKELNLNQSHLL